MLTHDALLGRGDATRSTRAILSHAIEHGRLEDSGEPRHYRAPRCVGRRRKRLLQDAAVVGRVFWVGALEAIGGVSRQDADGLLRALVRKEFVQRARQSSIAGDAEYAFRHELLRDVAYGEIPRAGKAKLHRRAAEWIDSVARPEDHAELLAHHYLAALDGASAAGEDVAILVERAGQALYHAGLRAIRLSANERAVEHFSRNRPSRAAPRG